MPKETRLRLALCALFEPLIGAKVDLEMSAHTEERSRSMHVQSVVANVNV